MKKFFCFVKTLVGTSADKGGALNEDAGAREAASLPNDCRGELANQPKATGELVETVERLSESSSPLVIRMISDEEYGDSAEIGSRGDAFDRSSNRDKSNASLTTEYCHEQLKASQEQSKANEEHQNSSEADTCSWEPKKKDVRMSDCAEEADPEEEWKANQVKQPDVIHPLQNSWGIWCFMQNRSQNWHENMRHISNFSSVEDFWSLYNHIQTVDKLPTGCDYFIFKANIQPMWEDKANVRGGRWLLKLPSSHQNFMQLWMETLLLLVGEAFESDAESVCGGVAQVRRGINKISIWTRDANDRDACMRIGNRWKRCLKTRSSIHYEAHLDANRKGGRRSKSVYSIN